MSGNSGSLVTSLAIICFQFCPIRWFVSLQSVNKYWYLIGTTLPLARKCLTLDSSWVQKNSTKSPEDVLLVDFVVAHPNFIQLVQLDIKFSSQNNFFVVSSFTGLKKLTLNFTLDFHFQPYHSLPPCLEEFLLDICDIDNIKHLTISSSTNPKLHTMKMWFYQRRIYTDSDQLIVESLLFPISHLTDLGLTSSRRFIGWSDQYIVRILSHWTQLNTFITNFNFAGATLVDLNRTLRDDFILILYAPRGDSPEEQEWFVNIHKLLNENPLRVKYWHVNSFYCHNKQMLDRENEIICFNNFKRIMRYLPLIVTPMRDDVAVMPSKYFESIEPWTELAQCRRLKVLLLIFDTPLLLTLTHIQALRRIYHQLTYFRLKTVQLSLDTFMILKQEIRLNMKQLVGCEDPLQNVHFLSTFQENELIEKQLVMQRTQQS